MTLQINDYGVLRGRDIVKVTGHAKDDRRRLMLEIEYVGPNQHPPMAAPWRWEGMDVNAPTPTTLTIYPAYLRSLDDYRPGGFGHNQVAYLAKKLSETQQVVSWIEENT